MIYFLQPLDGGPVKIGYSADVAARCSQIEAHYKQPLALLATMVGDRDEEKAVHERFAHLRINGPSNKGMRPEQFRPAPELMEFIGRPLLFDPKTDTVELTPYPASGPAMSIKMTVRFRDWIGRLADAERLTSVQIFEKALVEYAWLHNFAEPAPRRTEGR